MHEGVRYLNKENALDLFADFFQVSEQEATDALRDKGAPLESALASPINHALYEDADIVDQAACLGYAISKNHPFEDGNKRTTGILVETFLQQNGLVLTCSDDYLAAWIVALTLGMKMETFAGCLRKYVEEIEEEF